MKTRKPQNAIGKYGITGDHGFFGSIHLSAPFDCNGKVFVEDGEYWKRVTKREAKKKGLRVIHCSECDKPAVRLDHLWPYENKMTACAEHCKP